MHPTKVAFIIGKISIIALGILCNLIALSVYQHSRKSTNHQYQNNLYVINLTITGKD